MRLLIALLCVFGTFCADAHNVGGATKFPSLPSLTGLHVLGNHILNGSGVPVQLRGVDQDGAEYECLSGGSTTVFDGPANSASVAQLQSWAINIVRLPVNEQCPLGINGLPAATYSAATYLSTLVTYVNLLTSNNIAVIIDLQWTNASTTQSTGQTALPDLDHAPAFWTLMGNTFKGNSLVIFDLFNEPYPDSNQDTTAAWTCLLDGGTSAACNPLSWTNGSVGTQSLLNTIRATGATNIIMVPGVQYTNTLDQWASYEPTDTLSPAQIVASWHSYATEICITLSCWNSQIAPILDSVPVIAGEIGENDCQAIYIDPLTQWMDSHGGNYLAWAWNTYNCSSFPALISDYPTSTPTAFGFDYRTHLLALTGSPLPTPPVVPFFNSGSFPYGIRVGYTEGSNYTASDSTVYYPDVAVSGLTIDTTTYGFAAFTTADTITGTSDPTLFATGRYGQAAIWTFGLPNGTYYVTLGMAPNSAHTAGTTGQNQLLNGSYVVNCIWSSDPLPGGCGNVQTDPAVDTAYTVEYSVTVAGQALAIEVEAAGTATILNSIKISKTP